jgi:hypothetical protein
LCRWLGSSTCFAWKSSSLPRTGLPRPRERLEKIAGTIQLLCKHLRGVATSLRDPEEYTAWLTIDPVDLGANIGVARQNYLQKVSEEVREIIGSQLEPPEGAPDQPQ